ncbi:unnamed protein product, partial [Polarella glacialis]
MKQFPSAASQGGQQSDMPTVRVYGPPFQCIPPPQKHHNISTGFVMDRFFEKAKAEPVPPAPPAWKCATGKGYRTVLGQATGQMPQMPAMVLAPGQSGGSPAGAAAPEGMAMVPLDLLQRGFMQQPRQQQQQQQQSPQMQQQPQMCAGGANDQMMQMAMSQQMQWQQGQQGQ